MPDNVAVFEHERRRRRPLQGGPRGPHDGGMNGGGGDIPGRLDALEQDMREVRDVLRRLEPAIASVAAESVAIRADIAVLKADVAVLKADVAGLKTDVAEGKSDLKQVKAEMVATRIEVAGIAGQLKHIPTSLQLLGFAVAVFVAAGVVNWLK